MKKISQARNQRETRFLPASCWFLAWLTLRHRRLRLYIPLKRPSTFNRIYGVASSSSYFLFTGILIVAALLVFTISIVIQEKIMNTNAADLTPMVSPNLIQ
jgi:hypothetical protein